MSPSTEREVLDHQIRQLEAEGYDVFVEPGPAVRPPFVEDYVPDAVAIRDGRKVAIEVAGPASANPARLARVAAAFRDHPDWEFRIVWIGPTVSTPPVPLQSLATIEAATAEIDRLKTEGYYRPAFLLGWSAFEAAARARASEDFARPQPPDRLVDILSREGVLDPREADRMRALLDVRNRLAHGGLDAEVGPHEIDQLMQILRSMTGDLVT